MKKPRGLLVAAAAAALVLLLAASVLVACGSGSEATSPASPSADVVAAVKGDAQLSQFAQALGSAGSRWQEARTQCSPPAMTLSHKRARP